MKLTLFIISFYFINLYGMSCDEGSDKTTVDFRDETNTEPGVSMSSHPPKGSGNIKTKPEYSPDVNMNTITSIQTAYTIITDRGTGTTGTREIVLEINGQEQEALITNIRFSGRTGLPVVRLVLVDGMREIELGRPDDVTGEANPKDYEIIMTAKEPVAVSNTLLELPSQLAQKKDDRLFPNINPLPLKRSVYPKEEPIDSIKAVRTSFFSIKPHKSLSIEAARRKLFEIIASRGYQDTLNLFHYELGWDAVFLTNALGAHPKDATDVPAIVATILEKERSFKKKHWLYYGVDPANHLESLTNIEKHGLTVLREKNEGGHTHHFSGDHDNEKARARLMADNTANYILLRWNVAPFFHYHPCLGFEGRTHHIPAEYLEYSHDEGRTWDQVAQPEKQSTFHPKKK